MRRFSMMLVGGLILGTVGTVYARPSFSQLPAEKRQQLVSLRQEYFAKRDALIKGATTKASKMTAGQAQAERERIRTDLAQLKRDYAGRAISVLGLGSLSKMTPANRSQVVADLRRIKGERDAKLQALRAEAVQSLSKINAKTDRAQATELVQGFRERAAKIKSEARAAATAALQSTR